VPKVSQDHLDARRAEILAGARRAFARHGYDGTTVARLEAEIGLSRGAIFHYFESKLDLFAELAAADDHRYQTLLAEEGIEAVLRAIVEADRNWLTVLIETEVRLWHDPEFEQRMRSRQSEDTLLDGFAAAQAAGLLRDDIEVMDLVIFASVVVNGLALRVAGGEPPEIESFVRLVGDALRPR
jgi:TetR/AcrR family transcriptional regulator, transcriptional repressor of aconitase